MVLTAHNFNSFPNLDFISPPFLKNARFNGVTEVNSEIKILTGINKNTLK